MADEIEGANVLAQALKAQVMIHISFELYVFSALLGMFISFD